MRKPAFGKALAIIVGVLVFGIVVRSYIYTHQLQPLLIQGDQDGFVIGYIEKIYYPTYTRLDGLLVGVTLACIKSFRPLWWESLLSRRYLLLASGFACCGWALWLFRDRFSYSGTLVGFPLVSLGLGLLIAASISPQVLSPLCLLLQGRRGAWIRNLSVHAFSLSATLAYSLYLTHKEIGHLVYLYLPPNIQSHSWIVFLILFTSSVLAASLLYLAIERPFLLLRERLSAHRSAAGAETVMAG